SCATDKERCFDHKRIVSSRGSLYRDERRVLWFLVAFRHCSMITSAIAGNRFGGRLWRPALALQTLEKHKENRASRATHWGRPSQQRSKTLLRCPFAEVIIEH